MSRKPIFVLIYNHMRNARNFIIYELLVFVLLIAFDALNIIMAYLDSGQCPNIIEITEKFIMLKLIAFLIIPSALPIAVYLLATVYLTYMWIKRRRNSKRQVHSRLGKSFRLILKFLILAVIFAVNSMLQIVFFYGNFIFTGDSHLYVIIGDVGFLIYGLQPLFFIYIHSILRKTFNSMFFTLFNCRFLRSK